MEKRLEVRLSEEDYALLNKKCEQRGLDKSAYIREMIHKDNEYTIMHTRGFRKSMYDLSKVCLELEHEYSKENIEKLTKVAKELWLFLQ